MSVVRVGFQQLCSELQHLCLCAACSSHEAQPSLVHGVMRPCGPACKRSCFVRHGCGNKGSLCGGLPSAWRLRAQPDRVCGGLCELALGYIVSLGKEVRRCCIGVRHMQRTALTGATGIFGGTWALGRGMFGGPGRRAESWCVGRAHAAVQPARCSSVVSVHADDAGGRAAKYPPAQCLPAPGYPAHAHGPGL